MDHLIGINPNTFVEVRNMTNKVCEATVIKSTVYRDELSLRGWKDNSNQDIRKALKKSGFIPNDKVVIITKEYFEKLLKDSKSD